MPSDRPFFFGLILAAVLIGGFSAIFLWDRPQPQSANDVRPELPSPPPPLDQAPILDEIDAKFGLCGEGPRATCVVDGDTIWLYGTKIRIADINAPEISQPGCPYEAELGQQATRRLLNLLNEGAFSVELTGRDADRYGRKLRVITRQGESLGDVLVAEGLAEYWTGSRRNWC